MKIYKVLNTPDLEKQVKTYIHYIARDLGNPDAANRVWKDYKETRKSLRKNAGSLPDPESNRLKQLGLKRINFNAHDYFLLFRVMDDTVIVTNMFHFKEDYENKLR